ncbi:MULTISPECIES: hypothetical protein [unclassified Sphingomonas]|uniref:hypothetical protein n=1 Tax=unclassified Sphingomonas TaxID=196159 RepID=UPI001F3A4589|nr:MULTISPECIES: hypothetical protein [unclassified Sphingomonas]
MVALERADEGFSRSVRLQAADRYGTRDEADVAREAPGIASGIKAAVVGESLDRPCEALHEFEAMVDGGDHQVADIFGSDAAGVSNVLRGLPVAAFKCKDDAYLLAVVASNLQRVRAPAGVAPIDGDATVMTPFLARAAMGLERQAVASRNGDRPRGRGGDRSRMAYRCWRLMPMSSVIAVFLACGPGSSLAQDLGFHVFLLCRRCHSAIGWEHHRLVGTGLSQRTLRHQPPPDEELASADAAAAGDQRHALARQVPLLNDTDRLSAATASRAEPRIGPRRHCDAWSYAQSHASFLHKGETI